MYHKNKAYRRVQRKKIIKKKLEIIKNIYGGPYGQAEGQLSKGKVHCSCPLCAAKSSKDRGINTNSYNNYKTSDKRKFDSIDSKLNDE